ncbi:hypothetical protein K491DRAFT_739177 [Lophiostoma macrostomum CBS 122681]|uniref:F-box domain-containing protein n=1 Tax=Lophiostoma macrostomum CBS 122681 TaxID=1314788 RepID=A0A6A6SJP4_9PLEO|nr:hypothetical protein K491DRAFT_739177 [Lophiostoma macrostomum CBS 122681]
MMQIINEKKEILPEYCYLSSGPDCTGNYTFPWKSNPGGYEDMPLADPVSKDKSGRHFQFISTTKSNELGALNTGHGVSASGDRENDEEPYSFPFDAIPSRDLQDFLHPPFRIVDLPVELIEEILTLALYRPYHGKPMDAHWSTRMFYRIALSLSLVCKSFYHMVIPSLYSSLLLSFDSKHRKLSRTLESKPHLARYCKTLHLGIPQRYSDADQVVEDDCRGSNMGRVCGCQNSHGSKCVWHIVESTLELRSLGNIASLELHTCIELEDLLAWPAKLEHFGDLGEFCIGNLNPDSLRCALAPHQESLKSLTLGGCTWTRPMRVHEFINLESICFAVSTMTVNWSPNEVNDDILSAPRLRRLTWDFYKVNPWGVYDVRCCDFGSLMVAFLSRVAQLAFANNRALAEMEILFHPWSNFCCSGRYSKDALDYLDWLSGELQTLGLRLICERYRIKKVRRRGRGSEENVTYKIVQPRIMSKTASMKMQKRFGQFSRQY